MNSGPRVLLASPIALGVTPFGATPASAAAAQPATFAPGNPNGKAPVPAGMGLENVSLPNRVIGTGTPASCTSAAVLSAVTAGGVITFHCRPDPVTITLTATAANGPDLGGAAIRVLAQHSATPTGRLGVTDSISRKNTYRSTGQSFQNHPGIFSIGKGAPVLTNSTIQ